MYSDAAVVSNNPHYLPQIGNKVRAGFFGVNPVIQQDPLDVASGADTRKYSIIARNPIVKSALDTREAAVLWSDATVTAVNDYKKNPSFKEIDAHLTEFLNSVLENLEYSPFASVKKSMLRSAWTFGFTVNEIIWGWRDDHWVARSIKPKPSFNFNIYINNSDDIESLYYNQQLQTGESAYLDPRKFICAPWPVLRDGNYYGVSELQAIYHDVKLLEKFEESRAKGTQLLLIKPIVHYYDAYGRDPSEVEDAIGAVKGMESASVIRLPIKINPEKPGEPLKQDFIEVLPDRSSPIALQEASNIIKELKQQIMRTLGIGDDLGLTTTHVGSLAKAKVEYNVFTAKVQEAETWLENVINTQLIKPLIELNYGTLPLGYKYPRWQKAEVEESVTLETVNAFSTAIQAGIAKPNEAFIRETLGWPSAPLIEGSQLLLSEAAA